MTAATSRTAPVCWLVSGRSPVDLRREEIVHRLLQGQEFSKNFFHGGEPEGALRGKQALHTKVRYTTRTRRTYAQKTGGPEFEHKASRVHGGKRKEKRKRPQSHYSAFAHGAWNNRALLLHRASVWAPTTPRTTVFSISCTNGWRVALI